jgi:hypothetical protein
MVPPEEADKTLHGMRKAFGSWAKQQGYPEPDVERALTHIRGYGETDVARLYSGDATRDMPLADTHKVPANRS